MQRLIKTFIIALLVAIPLANLAPAPVYAAKQTQAEATACFDEHNGKTYADGSAALQKLIEKNACFKDKGNCQAKNVGTKQVKVKCTKKPGTNEAKNDQGQQESEDATNDLHSGSNNTNSETLKDDAVSGKAVCTTDNCELISNYINPLIVLLSVLVGIAVTVGIIFGAIQVITSAGDPQKNANGKDHIRNALIGLVAYIVLFGFLQWIIPGGLGS